MGLLSIVRGVQNTKPIQLPASFHQGIEDAQIGDRELQATTDRKGGREPFR